MNNAPKKITYRWATSEAPNGIVMKGDVCRWRGGNALVYINDNGYCRTRWVKASLILGAA